MSLITDGLAAIISAIAAGVPLLTFVYSYTLKARLEIRIGEEIILHYTSAMHLIFTTDFIFLNKGAQQAAVTGIFGTLWRGTPFPPEVPNLTWEKYEKTQRPEIGKPYQTSSSAIVEPIVISGRSAFTARVRLYSDTPLPLEGADGYYSVRLEAADGSAKLKSASFDCVLYLHEDDAKDLLSNGAEQAGSFRARTSLKRTRVTVDTVSASRRSGLLNRIIAWRTPARFFVFESRGRWRII